MVPVKRFLETLALVALCSLFVPRAYADSMNYSGHFAADNSTFSLAFSTATAQNYTFSTSSFATGGFVPVLTLFDATNSAPPIAFAETDNSDVSLSALLGPGSYLLYLTEDPNVFTSNLAGGLLFAANPTITGDLCGVSGGTFLNVFDGCSQRTSSYALTQTSTAVPSTAVTPEPATWLLMLAPVALLTLAQRRRQDVSRKAVSC